MYDVDIYKIEASVGASQTASEINISSETQKIYVLKAIQFLIEDVIMFCYDVIAVFGQSLAWSRHFRLSKWNV